MFNQAKLKRLNQEYKQLTSQTDDTKDMFTVRMVGDNIYHWIGTIYGPKGSLYEGGKFDVDIDIPEKYPHEALKVKFITKIEHVNVNQSGDICLDILKDKWTPVMSIRVVLTSICNLLEDPNIEDPLNHELANMAKRDPDQYAQRVKSCLNH